MPFAAFLLPVTVVVGVLPFEEPGRAVDDAALGKETAGARDEEGWGAVRVDRRGETGGFGAGFAASATAIDVAGIAY